MATEARTHSDDFLAEALAHHGAGRFEQALSAYDVALDRAASPAAGLMFKGAALAQAGRLPEALPLLAESFALQPDRRFNAAARQVLLVTIGAARRSEGSAGPDYSERREALPALYAWGMGLLRLRRAKEALGFFDHALRLEPSMPMGLLQRALALEMSGRLDEAVSDCRRVIEGEPEAIDGHLTLARLLNARKDYRGSIAALEQALALEPEHPVAIGGLVMAKRLICDWRDHAESLESLFAACERSRVTGGPAPINPSFAFNLPFTGAQHRALAEQHARLVFGSLETLKRSLGFSFEGRQVDKERLRIGYLSEGFRNYPTGHLIQRLFQHHDRGGFEIAAYAYGPDDGSVYRQRIAKTVDRFVDLEALSDEEAARRIHEDRIDILIDLKGYTIRARPRITALRPAPIQVNYLGYPGTWGHSAVDYILVDRIIVPSEEAANFSEALVHLPDCYQVNDDWQEIDETPQRRAEHGLEESAFVFCCFNGLLKLDPTIFDLWMRILHRVPGSQLWLLDGGAIASDSLRREAEVRGIEAGRLVFAKKLEKPYHLARHRLADLFLDSSVCSAHTTGTDALWAGLPLIACPTPTFPGRVAASLLTHVGLPELIVEDFLAYEDLAVRLATRPDELATLRAKLASQRETCRLFDTARFARSLETAYRAMWATYRAGREPQAFDIRDGDLPDAHPESTP